MTTLRNAIEAVRAVTQPDDPWTPDDLSHDGAAGIEAEIATILNAVVEGVLLPVDLPPVADLGAGRKRSALAEYTRYREGQ